LDKCCFFPAHALKWLQDCDYFPESYFELWDIYDKYSSKLGKEAAQKTVELKVGAHGRTPEKRAEDGRKGGHKAHEEKDEFGRSLLTMKLHEEKDELGRSVRAMRGIEKINAEKDDLGRSEQGVRASERLHAEKDEFGRSVRAMRNVEKIHAEKDEFGRSLHTIQLNAEKDELGRSLNAIKGLAVIHAKKDELGRSVAGVEAAARINSQVWESTIDGYRSTAAGVVSYHNGKGWDPGARIRIS
jgi:hypothetical protein